MDMINNFIGLTLQLSVPIVLGALCGTIAERGGIILLGVEGIMLIGAFAGVAGSYAAGSALAGVALSCIGRRDRLVLRTFLLKMESAPVCGGRRDQPVCQRDHSSYA